MDNKIVVALKAIIVHNRKVLTIQRSDEDDYGAGTWEFAGGKLEFGETLEDGLKREIKEEVGLDAEIQKLLYAAEFKTGPNRQIVLLTYLCSCEREEILLSDEHKDYLWANYAQLHQTLNWPIWEDLKKYDVFPLLDIE
jgi:8-oxo-dGTP diphosphatase